MKISAKAWNSYIKRLREINKKAYDETTSWMLSHTVADYPSEIEYSRALIEYANAIATKYGEASAELACMMYDATAEASGAIVPSAVPARTATYTETAMAVNGAKLQGEANVPRAVERLVKLAGQDTTLNNAYRDKAWWAWIPSGDTCAFCLTLGSRGWTRASAKTKRGEHAAHIHANCDCAFAIKFDPFDDVSGYDPQKLYRQYESASDGSGKDRINALRRENYAKNKEHINEQKREAYAQRKELEMENN